MRLSVRLCTELIFNLLFLIHRYLNHSFIINLIKCYHFDDRANDAFVLRIYSHLKVIIGCLSPHSEGVCKYLFYPYPSLQKVLMVNCCKKTSLNKTIHSSFPFNQLSD